MQGAMLYGPRDVRCEERPDPAMIEPTPMGHEYAGIADE
jgi:hypothetical protein